MNSCQNKRSSCGCCCGIFNLKIDASERRRVLLERTAEFMKVSYERPDSFVEYRRRRETAEEKYERGNSEIYVCPFFGFLELSRTGCLAHPSRTARENSQNFSFYGGSICQAYDCPNKEKDESGIYAEFLDEHFPDSEAYARLMGDTLFYSALEKLPLSSRLLRSSGIYRSTLLFLCAARLASAQSRSVTSFETSPGRSNSLIEEFRCLLPEEGPALEQAVLFLMDTSRRESSFSHDPAGSSGDAAEKCCDANR